MSRRFRRCVARAHMQPTDENGQPLTVATPGAPTMEERRRYVEAVLQATAPKPLTRAQQAEVAAIHQRRRELFPHLYND